MAGNQEEVLAVRQQFTDWLSKKQWSFREEDAPSAYVFRFELHGEDIPINLVVVFEKDRAQFSVLSSLPGTIPEEKRGEAYALLNLINDASDFGNNGITTQQGTNNWVINHDSATSGDGAYNPKERTLTDKTENTAGHTDTETTGQHIDTIGNTTHTDTHSNITDTDTVTEGEREDTESTGTHTDTTSYGKRVETEDNIEHTDTVSNVTYTDTHTTGEREDSVVVGSREDTDVTTQHTDTNTYGQRIDNLERKAYNDSVTEGARSDSQSIGSRTDYDINGEREDTKTTHYEGRGNIGVRSNQELIQQERDIANINILEIVSRDILSQIACTVLMG